MSDKLDNMILFLEEEGFASCEVSFNSYKYKYRKLFKYTFGERYMSVLLPNFFGDNSVNHFDRNNICISGPDPLNYSTVNKYLTETDKSSKIDHDGYKNYINKFNYFIENYFIISSFYSFEKPEIKSIKKNTVGWDCFDTVSFKNKENTICFNLMVDGTKDIFLKYCKEYGIHIPKHLQQLGIQY